MPGIGVDFHTLLASCLFVCFFIPSQMNKDPSTMTLEIPLSYPLDVSPIEAHMLKAVIMQVTMLE